MLLYLLILSVSTAVTVLGLQEGEVCANGGTYQSVQNCKQLIELGLTPLLVSSNVFNDSIICCPPEPISQKKCREYNKKYCPEFVLLRDIRLTSIRETTPEEVRVSQTGDSGTGRKPTELEFMALVGFGNDLSNASFYCTATIISERFVLFLAVCAETPESVGPPKWVRLLGSNLSDNKGDENLSDYAVERSFVHPQFKKPSGYYNIALLRLDRAIYFNEWVKPICLHNIKEITELTATAISWRKTDSASISDSLMKVNVDIFEASECQQSLRHDDSLLPRGIDSETMICAGDVGREPGNFRSDMGGPLVLKSKYGCMRQQVGIVSLGKLFRPDNNPAIYTRISYFVPWIESIVWPQNVTE